jgi:flavin reductase (DIM6/NTAB) family NADH-FMN oxidoreductase RutF
MLPSAFSHAMSAAVTGVAVITTGGPPLGQTVSAFSAISDEPPLLLVTLPNDSAVLHALGDRGAFAVNVLADGQAAIAETFRHGQSFSQRDWWPLATGAPPLLHGAAARFRCEVDRAHATDTHTLVIGRVTRAERGTATPLAYTRRGYIAPLAG